ncbi:hypothetical protein cyc_01625 [Cyclospora cayetanensis]|uniref:Uncharacterized protein n=1 Tax=Cyclospora cayetanensis TaxID=88456 RepID=A0A1D3D400_9EIME|nr:hypothetical protein cyc_01625 [Cyclospora cayetanensis]
MEGPPGLDLHEETEALRAQYLQFELASLLSCSPRKANLREATDLLTELLDIGFSRTDCLFQLALVHLKLGEYSLAKRRVETLLRMEPRNLSALSLHSLILDRASHDGVIGSLLIGVLAGMGARQRPPMSHPTHWSPQFST